MPLEQTLYLNGILPHYEECPGGLSVFEELHVAVFFGSKMPIPKVRSLVVGGVLAFY